MKRLKLPIKLALYFGNLIPLGWLVYALWSDTVTGTKFMTVDPVQKLNRELGDWALIFIIITLAIRPVAETINKRSLIAFRRMFGLFAFFYAFLHLSSYVAIDLQFNWGEFLWILARMPVVIWLVASGLIGCDSKRLVPLERVVRVHW